LVAANGR